MDINLRVLRNISFVYLWHTMQYEINSLRLAQGYKWMG